MAFSIPFICPSSFLSQKTNPRIDSQCRGFVLSPALKTRKPAGVLKPSIHENVLIQHKYITVIEKSQGPFYCGAPFKSSQF